MDRGRRATLCLDVDVVVLHQERLQLLVARLPATFGDLDEALAVANETDYGLTAAVFTRSLHDAWHAAEELRHGTVHINETTNYWDQLAPFGGAKKSGSGRELAGWIIDALTETKQITFDLAD